MKNIPKVDKMDTAVKILFDVEILVKLRFDYISTETVLRSEDKAEFETQLRKYFQKSIPEEKFIAYAMVMDGEIVSTAFLAIDEKPPGLKNPTGRYGTIMNVFTYPEYRGKGYATSVMNYLIMDAGARSVSVLDLYSTKAGKRLYEKLGFSDVAYSAMRYCMDK